MKRRLVIPTLGESTHLAAAVASARALGPAWQVVLVCPAARVAGLRQRFPAEEVVAETGSGLYAAVNDAVAAGAWEWFSYLNDDDLVTGALAQEIPAGADIVYGQVDYIDEAGRRVGSFPVESRPARLSCLLAAGVPALTPQGTVISRRAFETLGGFDTKLRYCGDFDFWLRAAGRGLRFAYRPGLAGAFRLRPGQLSGQRESAAAEFATVRARAGQFHPSFRLAWARTAFRLRHLPLILERRRLTGHWRSHELFAPKVS